MLILNTYRIVRRAIRNKKPTEKVCAIKQQLSDDMSQYGFACGYFGSLFMTTVATVIFALTETTEYEQLTGYGLTSGNKNTEEWLKPVDIVSMRFDALNLLQIQLSYHELSIDGDIHGDISSTAILEQYIVTDSDYIASIDYWLNADNSINSMRFITQNGVKSRIYGSSTNATAPDKSAMAEGDNFIFAGYITYTNDDKVTGMDVVMLNQETGLFMHNFCPFVVII